jgi:hypothetical protein
MAIKDGSAQITSLILPVARAAYPPVRACNIRVKKKTVVESRDGLGHLIRFQKYRQQQEVKLTLSILL